ncbi:hypothetical protein DYB37_005607 [Aphanomyces astaci]|uniref:LNR domain-containing protein n=2 Tax=Aphanomyces astaci TaxID=112090 RepID=A0A3R7ERG7_APHAT|nr:hypothetical protein DYB35_004892 [Aphanomyces astaci]RHZ11638.1 hypothetical protein DYB37_005607 [Aphanomyces astaci]
MKSIAVLPGKPRPLFGQSSSTRVQRGVHAFACVKHVVCAWYFAMLSFVFFKLSPSSVAAINAYAPLVTGCTYGLLALLHFGFVAASCRRSSSSSGSSSSMLFRRMSSIIPEYRPTTTSQASPWLSILTRCPRVSDDAIMLGLLTVELVCQNYKAFQVTRYAIDKWFVFAYVSCVVLNCVVSPWFLLGRRHSSAKKRVFLSWFNSVIGFCLSCVLPIVGILPPVLEFLLVDWTLSSDYLWYTRVLLLSRIIVASSPTDYVVKFVMDVNTLVSLRRLTGAMSRREDTAPSPPRKTVARSALWSKHSTGRETTLAKNATRVPHVRRSPLVVVYVSCSVTWGVTLWGLCIQALFFRQPCPPTCQAATTPLVDMTCHCKYLHINCHSLHNESLDVDTQLDPQDVGSTLFVLQVSRCDVRRGIPSATLAHQQSLGAMIFQFTKMRAWEGTLPATIMSLQLRQCDFDAMPAILQTKLPPLLTNLLVESTPLSTLPSNLDDIWQPLTNVFFFNTSLTTIPDAITKLSSLQTLYVTNNRLTDLATTWQTQLNGMSQFNRLDVGGNFLTQVPATLRPDIVLDLSCNPIAALPSGFDMARLTSKMVAMGETTYCNSTTSVMAGCEPATCATGCVLWAVGDRLCDLACFNAACEYDRGDCHAYGL